jgi:hypothetical protein
MSDLTFIGCVLIILPFHFSRTMSINLSRGAFGMWISNQQFTLRNIKISNAVSAIYQEWDWYGELLNSESLDFSLSNSRGFTWQNVQISWEFQEHPTSNHFDALQKLFGRMGPTYRRSNPRDSSLFKIDNQLFSSLNGVLRVLEACWSSTPLLRTLELEFEWVLIWVRNQSFWH